MPDTFQIRDIGGLMNRAGFKLLTIDVDEIEVSYPSIFHLMSDLQDMAENGAALRRSKHLHRDVLYAASAIYKVRFLRVLDCAHGPIDNFRFRKCMAMKTVPIRQLSKSSFLSAGEKERRHRSQREEDQQRHR